MCRVQAVVGHHSHSLRRSLSDATLRCVYVLGADQPLLAHATPPCTYRQRGTSSLQRLFRTQFPELVARCEAEFVKQLGKFRLERITKAMERFLAGGDYRRGVARIGCTNRG